MYIGAKLVTTSLYCLRVCTVNSQDKFISNFLQFNDSVIYNNNSPAPESMK